MWLIFVPYSCDLPSEKIQVSGADLGWKRLHDIHDIERRVQPYLRAAPKLTALVLIPANATRTTQLQFWRNIFFVRDMMRQKFFIYFTHSNLFQLQSVIQLVEFHWKHYCFRMRKTRVIQIAHWLHSLLNCSETTERSKFTLSAQTLATFNYLLSRKGLQIPSSPVIKCVAEVFLLLDLRVDNVLKSRLSSWQAWNLMLENHLQRLLITCLEHREIIQQIIFREL